MPLFVMEGWLSHDLCKELKTLYNDLIKVAAKDVNVIVDSLNVPVHALTVPISKDYVKFNSYANYG